MFVLALCCSLLQSEFMNQCSIYPRGQTWWLSYYDPATNKRVHRSTKIRTDDPMGRRQVIELARTKSKEAKVLKPAMEQSAWEHWAHEYLEKRYASSRLTRKRALGALKLLQVWLHHAKILTPAMLKYQHAQEWCDWRTSQIRPRGTPISINSALCDLRFLTILQREAVRRGYCPAVTIDRPGISKDPAKVKPEITAPELEQIRAGLKQAPEWMQESFEVAMAQGCRLSETQVPMDRVDEVRGTVAFRIKGGRMHTTALSTVLLPLVAKARKEKRKRLVELPPLPSKLWWKFFGKIGLPHLCFHCTRVTVISRLARRGVPIQLAMGFIGHADETVHKIYQRLGPKDYAPALAAIASLASDDSSESPGAPQSMPPPLPPSNTVPKTESQAAP